MEAVVLAGGLGTRLRSSISDRPKCMAEVAGRPFLEWLILQAIREGIQRFVLCTGYMGELVRSHFGNGSLLGTDISYSHETVPMGTGGALRLALDQVRESAFLVLNGDSYCRYDIHRLAELMKSTSARAVMWLVKMHDCSQFGSVDLGENGSILAFKEKLATVKPGMVNAGIYLVQRELVETIPDGRAVSLERAVFPGLIGGRFFGIPAEGPFIDIGTPQSYADATAFMRGEWSL